MDEKLEPLRRPDGRVYRSRSSGLRVRVWDNEARGFEKDQAGCIVFGTLDPIGVVADLARTACAHWFGDGDLFEVAEPRSGWWRDGYDGYGRAWIQDEQRGAPGVMFTWRERA